LVSENCIFPLSVSTKGADFHRTMVASATASHRRLKLRIGRRSMRNWISDTFFALLFSGKSSKTAAIRASLFDSSDAPNHSSAHWGAYSVPPGPLAGFKEP